MLNVTLARLLDRRAVVSTPENILQQKERRMPDVLVSFQGLRAVIEGKVNDTPKAEEAALKAAKQRVEEGIAHIGMAVVYPRELRDSKNLTSLEKAMDKSQYRVAVTSESHTTPYTSGDINYIVDVLRRVFEELVKDETLTRAVEVISEGLKDFSNVVLPNPIVVQRLSDALGIHETSWTDEQEDED